MSYTGFAFNVTPDTPDVRFLASLSDGTTAIQQNGTGRKSGWVNLKQYLKDNPGLKITGLRLQTKGRPEIVMPSNQKGYFFGNKSKRVFPGGQAQYVGIGYYDGTIVTAKWYRAPFYDAFEVEERSKADAGFFLIENPD